MHLGLLTSSQAFGRDQWLAGTGLERIEIEIGPGNCGYLVAAAVRAPRHLHVGIEILPSAVSRARSRGPFAPNVRLIEGDGGWIVRHLLAPSSIDAFHAYFPDPWWKKRHRKRRLFQSDFCDALARTLVPDGCVHVVTDVVPLFTEIRERMEQAGFHTQPWERVATDVECSSYERKYRSQGRRLEQARFRNRRDSSGDTHQPARP